MSEEQSVEPQGWDWHEKTQAQMEEIRQAKAESAEETKMAFEACFSTPAGQVVLDYLRDWALQADGFDPALGFYNGAANGFYREGQNRLIAFLFKMAEPQKRKADS